MVNVQKLYEQNVREFSNLADFFEKSCAKYPDNIFSEDLNYQQLHTKVLQKANYLKSLGCQKETVVAILGRNSKDWLISYLSVILCGAIALPLDYNLDEATLVKMANFVETKFIFADHDFLNYQFEGQIIDIRQEFNQPTKSIEQSLTAEDVCTYLYTSGTTGKPKIVQLTHGNIFKTAIASSSHLQLFRKNKRIVLHLLPLYHVYGLVAAGFAPMHYGYTYVFQSSLKGPDILRSLREKRINVLPAVPQLWEIVCDGILNKAKTQSNLKYYLLKFFFENGYKLRAIGLGFAVNKIFQPIYDIIGHNIDFFISGGTTLKPKYFRYYQSLNYKMLEGYGLTETSAPIFAAELNAKLYPGHVGKCFPGNQFEIRNKNNQGIGEIWIKGVSVMPGYLKNDEANAAVFDQQGWFNSGDLGFLDKRGNLHISGRAKNLIVLDSGKNVYPEELESYYHQSELVEEIAVFGRKIKGVETVYAVIYSSSSNVSYQAVKDDLDRLSHNLPSYKVIGKFALSRQPLPKTSKRTIINAQVIAKLDAGEYEQQETNGEIFRQELKAKSDQQNQIIKIIKEQTKQEILYAKQNLLDLDFDSLKILNLIAILENNLQISINEEQFTNCRNLQEMLEFLNTCPPLKNQELFSGEITTKPKSFFNPLLEILLLLIKPIFIVLWKFKIVNPENIKIDNNILVANHSSYLDIIAILISLKFFQRKNLYMIAKKELRILSFIFPGLPIIYVDRQNNTIPTLKAGADLLRQGKSLLLFPEGTRSRSGELNKFKTGAAVLAKSLNKKILPIAIKGAFDIYPPDKKFPKIFTNKILTINFAAEIEVQPTNTPEQITEEIQEIIAKNITC